MKNIVLIFLMVLASCQPEDASPSLPIDDDFDTAASTLLKQGVLEGIQHTASGVASIYETQGSATVVLDPYTSQNGPDLKIYLSKDVDAGDYIRLGNLKSTSGKQSYAIPKGTDLSQYKFVHVWCEKYTVVFARAELK
ncbi:DM13 domain-containing protein [Chryseolinea lacunae]|uniref:DM13 domain-containing protein n=1 Tax=Chryseolinea lacunae TaxID=2801331 RepID=A0ABS1KUZ7_9BACT|nr:DM13 domain-containing protein [Chryseolinea lacunae]MBL0743298.1 DM13 domain-containing protein [Chryseolinea lacunae]